MAIRYHCNNDNKPASTRYNTGKTWIVEFDHQLKAMWTDGMSIADIADSMGRTHMAICMRLMYLGFLKSTNTVGEYEVVEAMPEDSAPVNRIQPIDDCNGVPQIMSNTPHPTIETKIFINGNLASGMSDEAIYQAIANVEAEIKRLSEIRKRPKRLQAKLDEMAADITKLVEYVDGR